MVRDWRPVVCGCLRWGRWRRGGLFVSN
jgi:hypothetical protein